MGTRFLGRTDSCKTSSLECVSRLECWVKELFEVLRSVPRAKFPRSSQLKGRKKRPSRYGPKSEDVMRLSLAPDEVNRLNSARVFHFLQNLLDPGAINDVAPSSVWAKALVESNGSLNGMTDHTADGTRIPNLGQKTLVTVSEDGSTQLGQTFQIATSQDP